MSAQKLELLRQSLMGIQAHSAGMHANAEMALRLLGELRNDRPARMPTGESYNGRPAIHYGEADPAEMEQHFEKLESTAGIARTPDNRETPPAQE